MVRAPTSLPFRQISGLLWARRCTAPKHLPSRLTGSRAAGIRFQKSMERELRKWAGGRGASLESGPWFEFEDSRGLGRCQPDFLLGLPSGEKFILECKLTSTLQAWPQLCGLYVPVVEEALGGTFKPLVVVKNLHPSTAHYATYGELPEALASAASGRRTLWHSLGHIWGI